MIDVAIIGGGIVGLACAYALARRGASVSLFEKGRLGGEQSSRNWGFVRQQGRDPVEIPLMAESNRLWRQLETELEADIEWEQQGNLALAATEADLSRYEEAAALCRQFGIKTNLLTGEAVA
ncbi:MAG TPA: FAD-dependent oxidoreductase, partial [Solirubrobacterales bacterium]|nr:FAD-dependent oxidoreductase [Solirubrobacterales bacterium]